MRRSTQLYDLGNAIRLQRARRRLTQARAAARAEMHRNHYGAIERGENNPTFLSLVNIADALNVPVDRLIRDATSPSAEESSRP